MKRQTILFLLAGAFVLFWGCEKSDMTVVDPMEMGQNDQALHSLAKLLIADRSSKGDLAQKQIELYKKNRRGGIHVSRFY